MPKKLKKYPKKPKQSASLDSQKRYLERVKEIDRENARIKSEENQRKSLVKKIAGIRGTGRR